MSLKTDWLTTLTNSFFGERTRELSDIRVHSHCNGGRNSIKSRESRIIANFHNLSKAFDTISRC